MGAHHSHGPSNQRRLVLTLCLVVVYMVAEIVGGLISGSLALLADAGHMFSDAGALIIAVVAIRIALRAPSKTHTFGYRRAEVIGALANGATLFVIAGIIAYEAIVRLGNPPDVEGPLMLAVAAGGLVINLVGLAILHGGKSSNINVRGAWLHVLADTLGSVGAIASGSLITAFGWQWADPVASLIISGLIGYSSWRLIKQTAAVLMQAVPSSVSIELIEETLATTAGVVSVHDLHAWSMTGERPVVSAHLQIEPDLERSALMQTITERLGELDIRHSTIQLDCPTTCEPCDPSDGHD